MTTKQKSYAFQLEHKDPDDCGGIARALKMSEADSNRYFLYGDYMRLEVTVHEDLTITGRLRPMAK